MLRALPPIAEPDEWTLAFHTTSPYWWVRWFAFGRYKHVSAFAWVRAYGMWVYFNVTLSGTRIILIPDSQQGQNWLLSQITDADLVMVPHRPLSGKIPMIAPFYCVSAVKHLIGLRCCALRVSALHAHVLANGGRLIDGRARTSDPDAGADCAAKAGAD